MVSLSVPPAFQCTAAARPSVPAIISRPSAVRQDNHPSGHYAANLAPNVSETCATADTFEDGRQSCGRQAKDWVGGCDSPAPQGHPCAAAGTGSRRARLAAAPGPGGSGSGDGRKRPWRLSANFRTWRTVRAVRAPAPDFGTLHRLEKLRQRPVGAMGPVRQAPVEAVDIGPRDLVHPARDEGRAEPSATARPPRGRRPSWSAAMVGTIPVEEGLHDRRRLQRRAPRSLRPPRASSPPADSLPGARAVLELRSGRRTVTAACQGPAAPFPARWAPPPARRPPPPKRRRRSRRGCGLRSSPAGRACPRGPAAGSAAGSPRAR